VVREVREETGLRIQVCEKLGVFTHSYTRFRVKLHVFICKRKAGTVHNRTARWVTLAELEGLAMPSVNRRIVKKLEEHLNADFVD
jgi:8-oxo-dGTP pyrophosphatase MutT (NUDIX family)